LLPTPEGAFSRGWRNNTPLAESLSRGDGGDESEAFMLTLQIQDHILEKQLTELLQQKFNGNSEKMLQELVRAYTAQLNRLKYSGILKWEKDGLIFQKEIRSEWQ
jgi:hypothetical protein